jgi:glutamine amidotransferase
MITVVDYGMGNIRSVVKAIELFTDDVRVSSDPRSIGGSSAVVLPGDGAFAMAMKNLKEMGWIDPLKEFISAKGYFLGICLGYQLLFSGSEEFGDTDGLNIVPGRVIKFRSNTLKIPHMGWNQVNLTGQSAFMEGIPDNSYFYFIHSYHPVLEDDSWEIGRADYGEKFPCIIGKDNMMATQFHPEKSHKFGLKIIENFVLSIK